MDKKPEAISNDQLVDLMIDLMVELGTIEDKAREMRLRLELISNELLNASEKR